MAEQYTSHIPMDEMRAAFDALGLQQKAEFLLEATFSTFTSGIETAAQTISREMDAMFDAARASRTPEPDRRPADEAAPGAAEAASPPPVDL